MRSIVAADTLHFDAETETQNGKNDFHRVKSILAWLTCSKLKGHVICGYLIMQKTARAICEFRVCQSSQLNP
jgi:hypothetical protein